MSRDLLFDTFRKPEAITTQGANVLNQGEAVTETMLAPVLLFDKDMLYLLWYKCEHIKFKYNVSPGAVEVVAIFDNPTKDQLQEVCASFPEEVVKLPERRCAVSLGNVRVWHESASRIETTTFTGIKAKINTTDSDVLSL